MKEQSRQITTFFNVVSQLVFSVTKLKRKLIVIFSSDDLTFTNSQRVSNIKVVKFTKRIQIIRIEIVKIKKTKIHENSIESLIFLNFETTRFEQKNALFVNKHVFLQLNQIDSFINVFNFTNFSISNQSFFSESIIVDLFDFFLDSIFVSAFVSIFIFVSISVFVSIFETTFISTHQWLSRNVNLIDNHFFAAIVFNILDTSLSSSFIDSISFFNENFFSQITTITLQNSFKRARREIRQQIKNVYSYDSIINQIIRSFYSDAFSTKFNHLLLYFFTIVNIQISISATRKIKQKREIDRFRDRFRENDVEKSISRAWFLLSLKQFSNDQHQQKIINSAVQCAQVQECNDDVLFTWFNNQKVRHHCYSRIVNQRICEHHSSFSERQSFFILFESDRNRKESCSCMHFRH
jgi:hypothetical protein